MVDISREFVRDHIADSAVIYKRGVRIYEHGSFILRESNPEKGYFNYHVDGNYGDYTTRIQVNDSHVDTACDCPYPGTAASIPWRSFWMPWISSDSGNRQSGNPKIYGSRKKSLITHPMKSSSRPWTTASIAPKSKHLRSLRGRCSKGSTCWKPPWGNNTRLPCMTLKMASDIAPAPIFSPTGSGSANISYSQRIILRKSAASRSA